MGKTTSGGAHRKIMGTPREKNTTNGGFHNRKIMGKKTTTHGSFPRKIKGKSWENIEHTTINIIHGGVQRKIIGEYGKKGKSWN